MSSIFISYRREDTGDVTGRIYDWLEARFGTNRVFKDVDSIPLGQDFRVYLQREVDKCAVMLVIIGPRWMTITDDMGQRRLDQPNDFVRIEVEAGLTRGIPVIPLLVGAARMPSANELPSSIRELSFRNATDIRPDPHFRRDLDQLGDKLERMLYVPTPVEMPPTLQRLEFAEQDYNGVKVIVPPMVAIPGGSFRMGSDKTKDPLAGDNELPQHTVTVDTFEFAVYPVTVAEWVYGMEAGVVSTPPRVGAVDWAKQLQNLDHPVVCVSWTEVMRYIAWLSRVTGDPWRLPTEAEWERAARGSDGRLYPWGNQWDKTKANTSDGGPGGTTQVGRYAQRGDACPFGLHDMAGNVWEWTSSLAVDYPYQFDAYHENNDDVRSLRVLRGGSWAFAPQLARTTFRWFAPGDYGLDAGFRLARGQLRNPEPRSSSRVQSARDSDTDDRRRGVLRRLFGRS